MKNIYITKSRFIGMALRHSLVCFAIVFVSIILHQISFAQSQKSVSEILEENGRIKSGVNGSYNASGYTLEYGESKEPIFKKSNSLQKVSTITWSALGSGVGNSVSAIAVSGSDVYVGGNFTTAGGISANYIAKWNTSTSAWSALATGMNGQVNAIAVSGSNVYVGGWFTTAGGSSAKYIAKWNGTWSALGSGMDDVGVNAIAVSGSDVYVGGTFTTAGGITVNRTAKWNGSAWSALGAGTNFNVYEMAVNANAGTMMVGGAFTTADGTTVNYIAKFTDSNNPLPVELTKFSARINGSSVLLNWQTATEVNNFGFEIERKTIDNWKKVGFVEGAGTSNAPKEYLFIDKNPSSGKYSYRLKQIDRDGKFSYSQSVEVEIGVVPKEFSLSQNYPNPFNPTTTIRYSIPLSSRVNISVYNLLGQVVDVIVNEEQSAGWKEVKWNASGFASGMYFYKLTALQKDGGQAGNFVETKKMIVVK